MGSAGEHSECQTCRARAKDRRPLKRRHPNNNSREGGLSTQHPELCLGFLLMLNHYRQLLMPADPPRAPAPPCTLGRLLLTLHALNPETSSQNPKTPETQIDVAPRARQLLLHACRDERVETQRIHKSSSPHPLNPDTLKRRTTMAHRVRQLLLHARRDKRVEVKVVRQAHALDEQQPHVVVHGLAARADGAARAGGGGRQAAG